MKIAWIGLGHMGLPMATHLSDASFDVSAYDLSEDARAAATRAGITTTDSVVECVSGADIIFTMLPTGTHVRSALLDSGAIERASAHALFVDSSTASARDAHILSDAIHAAGRVFADAPVSGGQIGAINGTLTFMVGGTTDAVDRLQPLLTAMGSRIFHVGGTGCGQSAKTVNNMMLAMNMASVSEAAVLADRLGLDPHTIFEICTVSTSDSWVLRNFYPVPGVVATSPATADFKPGFSAHLMRKDVGLALEAADIHGIDAGMTSEAARRLDQLIESGDGNLDFSAIVRIAEGAAPSILGARLS